MDFEAGSGFGVEGIERSWMNASIPLRAKWALWFWRLREAGLLDAAGGFGLETSSGARGRWRDGGRCR